MSVRYLPPTSPSKRSFRIFWSLILIVVVGPDVLAVDSFLDQRVTLLSKNLHHYNPDDETKNPSSTRLFKSKYPPGKISASTEYLEIKSDGSDSWRTMDVIPILEAGGVGVVPTDAGYGFVALLDSRSGLERILRVKGVHTCKKPLSLLCADLKSVDKYCYGISRGIFKTIKKAMPGPYTFILPASTALPKMMFFDGKGKKHSWGRKSVGVRIPNDPVLRYLQDELLAGAPMLVSSLPIDDNDEGSQQQLYCSLEQDSRWCDEVDFVIDAGPRAVGSTIYDFTGGDATLVREGLGEKLLV